MNRSRSKPAILLAGFAALTLAALTLGGCAASPSVPTISGAVDVRGEWMLVVDEEAQADPFYFPVTLEFTNGNARVRTGCYEFDQPMTGDLEVVTVLATQPLADCQGVSEARSPGSEMESRCSSRSSPRCQSKR
jgi:hypothetical protein